MNLFKVFLFSFLFCYSAFGQEYNQLGKFENTSGKAKSFNYVISSSTQKLSTISIGLISKPETLLPLTDYQSIYEPYLLHDTLFKKDLSNSVEYKPLIATSARFDNIRNWVEFDLNDYARFSDNSKITAEDIEFSFNYFLKNGSQQIRKILQTISSVRVKSPKTIRFELSKKGIDTILFLTQLPVLSKKTWGSAGISRTKDIAFSGPYVLSNGNLKSAVLQKNGYYFNATLPSNTGYNNFTEIHINSYNNKNELRNAFETNQIDVSLDHIVTNKAPESKTIKINKEDIFGIFLNTTKDTFKNKDIRQGFLLIFSGIIPVTQSSLFEEAKYQGFNFNIFEKQDFLFYKRFADKNMYLSRRALFEAKSSKDQLVQIHKGISILKDNGYTFKDGVLKRNDSTFTISLLVNKDDEDQVNYATVLQENLKSLGVTLKLVSVDAQDFQRKLSSYDYEMTFADFEFSPYSKQDFTNYFAPYANKNYARFNLTEIQALIDDLDLSTTFNDYKIRVQLIDKEVMFNYIYFPIAKSNTKRIISRTPLRCPDNLSEFRISLCQISTF